MGIEGEGKGYAEENALRVGGGVILRVFDVAISLSEGWLNEGSMQGRVDME